MKIDRLLGITIYLLNHKKTNAQELAEHFEVSVRTILRDIDSLCMAGIPVISTYGADGGYEMHNTFRMERQVAGEIDYSYIVTALKGFATAYESKELTSTLEKIQTVSKGVSANMVLDFGVLSEKKNINRKLSILEQAIKEKYTVTLTYTNADNVQKNLEVESVAAMYKWYSWYLLCYFPKYKNYGTLKLERMDNIEITNQHNSIEHDIAFAKEQWEKQESSREYIQVKLLGKSDIKVKCLEYLKGEILSEEENGDFILTFSVPHNEVFWYGALLSFGNKIKVLEPQELRDKICRTCEEILDEYLHDE